MFGNIHINEGLDFRRRVWYTGDDALVAGQGVCYDVDYTTTSKAATDVFEKRLNVVTEPDNTNNNNFAGVLADDYDAKEGGYMVEIICPGGVALVDSSIAATIGDNSLLTCIAGGTNAGKFGKGGFEGCGSARVLQTITSAGLVLVKLLDGPESGLIEELVIAPAGGAVTPMKGGVTRIPAETITANATYTLADGNFYGEKKAIELTGALTTSDLVVTVTNGVQLNGTTALATASFDGDNDTSVFEWFGQHWKLIANSGTALA